MSVLFLEHFQLSKAFVPRQRWLPLKPNRIQGAFNSTECFAFPPSRDAQSKEATDLLIQLQDDLNGDDVDEVGFADSAWEQLLKGSF